MYTGIGMSKLGNNGGRSYDSLVQPVTIDCNFVVDSANGNGLGIRNLKGPGVANVFMHTSATPGAGANGYVNPNPASGYVMVQFANNYFRYARGYWGIISPLNGSNIAINASALTAGLPYVISAVGAGTAGAATVAPVADVSGSLASTWFRLFDSYGNVFILYFIVNGTGSAPAGVSGIPVPIVIATNASAATIGAALVVAIQALPSGVAGVFSFTASGTTTVTITSTASVPLAGIPQDGAIATGFTFALTKYKTNLQNWQNVGLPKGLNPTVGQSFIATATGDSVGGGSSGTVVTASVSGMQDLEVVGDPNQSLNPAPQGGSPFVGGFLIAQMLAPTISGVTMQTPLIPTAPVNGSVVNMSFVFESKSVLIGGE
jgi:hypothetical protein